MCIIHTVNNFEDAKKLIDENPNCIILDVREEEEYATGHVKDAVLFPVDDITPNRQKKLYRVRILCLWFIAEQAVAAEWRHKRCASSATQIFMI